MIMKIDLPCQIGEKLYAVDVISEYKNLFKDELPVQIFCYTCCGFVIREDGVCVLDKDGNEQLIGTNMVIATKEEAQRIYKKELEKYNEVE